MYFIKIILLCLFPHILDFRASAEVTYAPVLPPSYPLAVRNPYLSAWLPASQVSRLPTSTPQFWSGQNLSLALLARVDNTVYKLFSAPASLSGSLEAAVVNASYTATHSIFVLTAGSAMFTIDFLSPVSPKNYLRQSLPFSYVTVTVTRAKRSSVQVYADVDETWTGQSGGTALNFTSFGTNAIFQLTVKGAASYSQNSMEQALWGEVVFASRPSAHSVISTQCGSQPSVRNQFVAHGSLTSQNPAFAPGNVIAISQDLGLSTRSSSVIYAIGYVREEAINYLGKARTHYYRSAYSDTPSAVSHFLDDFSAAQAESLSLDAALVQKANATGGSNYSDTLTLSLRQAFGGTDLTIPGDTLNTSDVMVFMKEISSDGNVNTLDVIFPAFPVFYVMNLEYIRLLLEPILEYLGQGRWTQPFAIHDIGTHYPNATGHDDQVEEDMPVEESGNFILLACTYISALSSLGSSLSWAAKYLPILQKYANYLVSNGFNEPIQLATNDCCGPLANQTNLAIKASIALNAFGSIFNSSQIYNASSYRDTGLSLSNILYNQGYALDTSRTHFKLQYGPNVLHGGDASFGVMFNLFPDILLNLSTFPQSTYNMLAAYYPTTRGPAGVPLDSRVDWSSTFWTNWAAASVESAVTIGNSGSGVGSGVSGILTRNMFINDVWAYMSSGLNDVPFSDRWFCEPGSGGLVGGSEDKIGGYDVWRNRPVVGGNFAVLALQGANLF